MLKVGGIQKTQVFRQAESRGFAARFSRLHFAARIGGSTAFASRRPRTRDNIPPATQASKSSKGQILWAVENFYDHSIPLLINDTKTDKQ